MTFPSLKIVKTEPAGISYGDYGADTPQGAGQWSWRTPAVYRVAGPTGRIYTVTGSGATFMQRSVWRWECAPIFECGRGDQKGGFETREACLAAIEQREQAALTP